MSEIDEFEGDMFWDHEYTDDMIDDPEDLLNDLDFGSVVCFDVAKRLPCIFGVQIQGSEPGDRISKFFTTAEEAEVFAKEHP